jgi:hypothetical protein
VSIKDQSLLVPLVMLNACLIFSWSNKVPFDYEASGTIRAEINSGAHIGAKGGAIRDAKSELKGRLVLIPSSQTVPVYCRSMICPAALTE